MTAPVLTLALAAPLNVVLNYLLVWGPDSIRLGFIGAPLATAISMNAMFLVSIAYAIFFVPRDAWGGFSWDMFRDLGLNVKLGLAGTAMVASEWVAWELIGLASSFLGPTALAAQSVLLTSASAFYQIPYSLSVAAAVRVGSKCRLTSSSCISMTHFCARLLRRSSRRTKTAHGQSYLTCDALSRYRYRRRQLRHACSITAQMGQAVFV